MMQKYLRQLTQISIINFFFILGLLFFIQKNISSLTPKKINVNQKVLAPSPAAVPSTEQSNSIQNIPTVLPTSAKKDLFSEISAHNSKSDCWIGVSGHLYDVTTYFGSHPGGDGVILKYCGTDATGPFQSKDGIGASHSASAYDLLHQYLIQ